MKKKAIALLMSVLILTAVPVTADEPTQNEYPKGCITVSADSSVVVTPDIATIRVNVRSEGTESSVVQDKNSKKVNALKKALLETGVEERNFKTSGIILNPVYSYSFGTEKLKGYEALVTITISNQKTGDVGNILKTCTDHGATEVDDVVLSYSNYDEAYNIALSSAVKIARGKAEAIADTEGLIISRILSVDEKTSSNYILSRGYKSISTDYEEAVSYNDSAIDYSVGESEIKAGVTITYYTEAR